MTRILEATQSFKREASSAVCALEEVDTPSDEGPRVPGRHRGVLKTTKRPIVLTCNDPAKVPPQVLDLVDALEFRQPTCSSSSSTVLSSWWQSSASAGGRTC